MFAWIVLVAVVLTFAIGFLVGRRFPVEAPADAVGGGGGSIPEPGKGDGSVSAYTGPRRS